ncbi:hypothetical protein [Nostoc sp.]
MKTTPPKRKPNKHYRSREYLTPSEVRSLLNATLSRTSRYGERDFLLMLMMFRHGLRVGEAVGEKCGLRWDAVMWGEGQIFITRENLYLAPGNLNVNSMTKCQVSQTFNVL